MTMTLPSMFILLSLEGGDAAAGSTYCNWSVLADLAAFARQHLVHHLAGEAEIACGIAHLVEFRARQMLGDFGILRQELDQRDAGGGDLAADVVDEVMRALTAEVRAQPHHHSFRYDH